MADEPTFQDTLSLALQSTLNRKLISGENVLMTLAGATGEGLIVTDQRVLIVREQMPIVGSETEVDCFDYSYEQIQTVRVESAVGGGHLKLTLFAPPSDEQHVTLYFPTYELAKFETAAARISVLAEQTRGMPVAGSTAPISPTRACPKCGSTVEAREAFCSQCGSALADICAGCWSLLSPGAQFCSHCGERVESRVSLACTRCNQAVSPSWMFCPHCGERRMRARCPQCQAPALEGWGFCPHCGHAHGSITNRPTGMLLADRHGEAPRVQEAVTAEEHNARGMSLYEQEQYEEAAREFETALDLAPGTPLFHCNLGVAYAEMGRDDEALEEYQVAMRLAPNDPTPYLNMGYFYAARENKTEARQAWQQVLALAPDSAEADEARQNLAGLDEV